MWLFWYCVDDHLAELLEMPGLGEIPFWVAPYDISEENKVETEIKHFIKKLKI